MTSPSGPDVSALPQARPVPLALTRWRPESWLTNWLWTLAVAAVAAGTRFWSLSFPHEKIFDEVYYATEAQELLRYGYEDNRDYMFIVHPPLGKWCIAVTSWLWGEHGHLWKTSPEFGFRAASAIAGTISVVLVVRVAQRMLRSTLLGVVAGLLLALDGISLVMSRVALLDIFLQTFILAAFVCLVLDRDQLRSRLGALYAAGVDLTRGVPALGPRPWRLMAGVLFGCALAVKWSAWSFWIGFALMSLVWDRGAMKAAGVDSPWWSAIKRGWPSGFFSLGVSAIGSYLLTWTGWFVGENSWNRHWGETHPGTGPFGWLPAGIRALANYHHDAYKFHIGLNDPHAYEANPWSWLILGRPISFYYPSDVTGCGAAQCSREILLIGTPLMYWAIIPMLLWALWHWVTTRDWRAGAVLVALLAGWVIWLKYQDRTSFLFYMTPLMPFLMIGLALAVGAMLSIAPGDTVAPPVTNGAPPTETVAQKEVGFREWLRLQGIAGPRMWRLVAVSAWFGAVIADFIWMWPIFTGGLMSYAEWHTHMWFPSWI